MWQVWTIIQQNGPDHLGLWFNVVQCARMALITSGCGSTWFNAQGSVPEPVIESLYTNAYKALKPGGRLLVHDFMVRHRLCIVCSTPFVAKALPLRAALQVDDSLDGPPLGALWALQHVTVNASGLGAAAAAPPLPAPAPAPATATAPPAPPLSLATRQIGRNPNWRHLLRQARSQRPPAAPGESSTVLRPPTGESDRDRFGWLTIGPGDGCQMDGGGIPEGVVSCVAVRTASGVPHVQGVHAHHSSSARPRSLSFLLLVLGTDSRDESRRGAERAIGEGKTEGNRRESADVHRPLGADPMMTGQGTLRCTTMGATNGCVVLPTRVGIRDTPAAAASR